MRGPRQRPPGARKRLPRRPARDLPRASASGERRDAGAECGDALEEGERGARSGGAGEVERAQRAAGRAFVEDRDEVQPGLHAFQGLAVGGAGGHRGQQLAPRDRQVRRRAVAAELPPRPPATAPGPAATAACARGPTGGAARPAPPSRAPPAQRRRPAAWNVRPPRSVVSARTMSCSSAPRMSDARRSVSRSQSPSPASSGSSRARLSAAAHRAARGARRGTRSCVLKRPAQRVVGGQLVDHEVAPARVDPGDARRADAQEVVGGAGRRARPARACSPQGRWRRFACMEARAPRRGRARCPAARSAALSSCSSPSARIREALIDAVGVVDLAVDRRAVALVASVLSRGQRGGDEAPDALGREVGMGHELVLSGGAARREPAPTARVPWRGGRGSAPSPAPSARPRRPGPRRAAESARRRARGGRARDRRAAARVADVHSSQCLSSSERRMRPISRAQRSAASGRYSVEPKASSAMKTWRRASSRWLHSWAGSVHSSASQPSVSCASAIVRAIAVLPISGGPVSTTEVV